MNPIAAIESGSKQTSKSEVEQEQQYCVIQLEEIDYDVDIENTLDQKLQTLIKNIFDAYKLSFEVSYFKYFTVFCLIIFLVNSLNKIFLNLNSFVQQLTIAF
jgi:hypothetical protein